MTRYACCLKVRQHSSGGHGASQALEGNESEIKGLGWPAGMEELRRIRELSGAPKPYTQLWRQLKEVLVWSFPVSTIVVSILLAHRIPISSLLLAIYWLNMKTTIKVWKYSEAWEMWRKNATVWWFQCRRFRACWLPLPPSWCFTIPQVVQGLIKVVVVSLSSLNLQTNEEYTAKNQLPPLLEVEMHLSDGKVQYLFGFTRATLVRWVLVENTRSILYKSRYILLDVTFLQSIPAYCSDNMQLRMRSNYTILHQRYNNTSSTSCQHLLKQHIFK